MKFFTTLSFGLFLAGFMGCGSSSSTTSGTANNVNIPTTSYVCSQSNSEKCYNKNTIGYYATDTCTVANMNAGKYVAQSGTVSGASDCDGSKCTTRFTDWYPVGTTRSGTKITTMASGTYRICVFVDTNSDTTIGNSGDYVGELANVSVTSSTNAQAVSSFSVLTRGSVSSNDKMDEILRTYDVPFLEWTTKRARMGLLP